MSEISEKSRNLFDFHTIIMNYDQNMIFLQKVFFSVLKSFFFAEKKSTLPKKKVPLGLPWV